MTSRSSSRAASGPTAGWTHAVVADATCCWSGYGPAPRPSCRCRAARCSPTTARLRTASARSSCSGWTRRRARRWGSGPARPPARPTGSSRRAARAGRRWRTSPRAASTCGLRRPPGVDPAAPGGLGAAARRRRGSGGRADRGLAGADAAGRRARGDRSGRGLRPRLRRVARGADGARRRVHAERARPADGAAAAVRRSRSGGPEVRSTIRSSGPATCAGAGPRGAQLAWRPYGQRRRAGGAAARQRARPGRRGDRRRARGAIATRAIPTCAPTRRGPTRVWSAGSTVGRGRRARSADWPTASIAWRCGRSVRRAGSSWATVPRRAGGSRSRARVALRPCSVAALGDAAVLLRDREPATMECRWDGGAWEPCGRAGPSSCSRRARTASRCGRRTSRSPRGRHRSAGSGRGRPRTAGGQRAGAGRPGRAIATFVFGSARPHRLDDGDVHARQLDPGLDVPVRAGRREAVHGHADAEQPLRRHAHRGDLGDRARRHPRSDAGAALLTSTSSRRTSTSTRSTVPGHPRHRSGWCDGSDFVVGAECSLDGAAPVPCASPYRFSGLSEGPHRFEIVATDLDGQRNPTPAMPLGRRTH